MKIKKYIADSMPEALQKVREDLGPRAVLLNTRHVKKEGTLGVLSKRKVEVTAALDDAPPLPQRVAGQPAPDRGPDPSAPPPAGPRTVPSGSSRPAPEPPIGRPQVVPSSTSLPAREAESGEGAWADRLSRDLRDMRESLRTLAQSQNRRSGGLAIPLPGQLRGLADSMKHADFDPEVVAEVVERLLTDPGPGGFGDREGLEQGAARLLTQGAPRACPIAVKEGVRSVVAFVGASGVGKTTVAAKIAAEFALRANRRVCLVAADVERVGGLDQIRALAEMIRVPLEVVYTPEEMEKAIRSRRDVDLILIDTPGLGPRDREKLKDLEGMVREASPNEVHLVLSATTSSPVMADTAGVFKALGTNRLIFTKLDESTRLGGVLMAASRLGLPLSHLSDGRSVPGDLRAADTVELALLALRQKTT